MIWAIILLSILVLLFYRLYRTALRETNAIRSLYILSVLDKEYCAVQHKNIYEYLATIKADNAMEVGVQFIAALDGMATKLARANEGSSGMASHAALWSAYKKVKEHKP